MAPSTYGSGSVKEVGKNRYRLRWSVGRDPFTGVYRHKSKTITAKNMTEARRELAARVSTRRNTSYSTLGDVLDAAVEQLLIARASTNVATRLTSRRIFTT